ncbi:MAG: thioredoxin family protein [Pseudomonadota bacterium]
MGLLSKLFSSTPVVTPTHIDTVAQFEEQVLQSELPVIVNIWSPTCAPCRRLAPELTATATKYPEKVKVVEIGTMAEGALLGRLGVRATPTTIIYEEGEELHRFTGYRSRQWFGEMIEQEFGDGG